MSCLPSVPAFLRFWLPMLAAAQCTCGSLAGQASLDLTTRGGAVWAVKAAAELAPGEESSLHRPGGVSGAWIPARVPGTVLAAHVEAGLDPDPNRGDNVLRVNAARQARDHWYRAEFTPPALAPGARAWLCLGGANRDAEVHFNGRRVGELRGIVQRGRFEVTALLAGRSGPSVVAVLVRPPVEPLSNGASPTYGSSAGWDWMPRVPGLNAGLTDDVSLEFTGDVSLLDPWVRCELPTRERALLSIDVDLANASAQPRRGVLHGLIEPGKVSFELPVSLAAGESRTVTVDHRGFPSLVLSNPALWWPNGYGAQPLHRCELSFVPEGSTGASDRRTVSFGVRSVEVDTKSGPMRVKVNGVPIFVRGGNWGMPEYMLRCDPAGYDTRVRLHRDMNFNMIRNWLGSTTHDSFYEACDRHGILVWDDFWLNSSGGRPRDLMVFQSNVVEKLRRLRNHPSIALWCGCNEGVPPAPLDEWIAASVRAFDGRHYHSNSHSVALSGSGPWTHLPPRDYFLRAAPGNWGGDEGWGMRSEMGAAAFVNIESLAEFLPPDRLWPRNELWDRHFFGPSAQYAGPDLYMADLAARYGPAYSAEEFCRKAQLLNIETHKAMFEGWRDRLWNDATGLLLWMSQSAYPSLVWQTYDYYFDATGAYWGAKSACEPVHIQWNCGDNSVKVVNNTLAALTGLHAEARVFGLDGRERVTLARVGTVDVAANSLSTCFQAPPVKGDLAAGRPVLVSSVHVPGREGDKLTDGDEATRWESDFSAQPWASIDLGEPRSVGRVVLRWEAGVHAVLHKIQVSLDGLLWKDAFAQTAGRGGVEQLDFPEQQARHVRLYCQEKATGIGVSLRAFEVYAPSRETLPEGTHFLRLSLFSSDGHLVSSNLYWRSPKGLDYRDLDGLPQAKLGVELRKERSGGDALFTACLTNLGSGPAFAIRLQVVDARTGKRFLPLWAEDNYLTLMQGESRTLSLRFACPPGDEVHARLVAQPYNSAAVLP